MEPAASDEGGASRLRGLASRVAERVGGMPAVRTLVATLTTYDRVGGGLVAAGLAYSALVAIVPGLLLALSAIGLLVDDPAQRERIVGWIARAVPPLEEVSDMAFRQVSAGAVPTGIVAIVGLLWGSSRFYAAIDNAFALIFQGVRRRNEVERTIRGVLLTFVVVAMPLLALAAGAVIGWLLDLAPGLAPAEGVARFALQLASPLGSLVLFVAATVLVYRLVPVVAPPLRAMLPPAVVVGVVLAAFAQLFTWIGPRLAGAASVFGTFVALFAVLAWLSISFNLLLVGAAWTRVRALALAMSDEAPADRATASVG